MAPAAANDPGAHAMHAPPTRTLPEAHEGAVVGEGVADTKKHDVAPLVEDMPLGQGAHDVALAAAAKELMAQGAQDDAVPPAE